MGYTKLFNKILASSVWNEDLVTKVVWITLLALKDQNQVVQGSVGGVAHQARVSLEQCKAALEKLSSPDPDDSSKVMDGRRIAEVPGGWFIVNGQRYRDSQDEDERRAWRANYMREYRKTGPRRKQNVNFREHSLTSVNTTEHNRTEQEEKSSSNGSSEHVQAALSLGSDVMQSKTRKTPLMTNAALEELKANPAYRGLDLTKEAFKFNQWCDTNGKQKTKRRFVNWINRIA